MSLKSLTTVFGAIALAGGLSACSSLEGRTAGLGQRTVTAVPEMKKAAAVYNPCISVGIEVIPNMLVTNDDVAFNRARGYRRSAHRHFAIFSKEPPEVVFAPLVGGLLGGLAGSSVGGGLGSAVAGTAGAAIGAKIGDELSQGARIKYLTNLADCRDYLNGEGPIEYRKWITDEPADRPHGAPSRVYDNQSQFELQVGPASATSYGGVRYKAPLQRGAPEPFGGYNIK